jgi:hypothetical protein
VHVAGGSYESTLYPDDFPALKVPTNLIRGHLTTMITLTLEVVASAAPEVGFVHDFPGIVRTPLFDRMEGFRGVFMRFWLWVLEWLGMTIGVEECGERHLWFATQPRFKGSGEELVGESVKGCDGVLGSGVYSMTWDGECASEDGMKVLAAYRAEGMAEKIMDHATGEFNRILG